jgi:hypothetical protein
MAVRRWQLLRGPRFMGAGFSRVADILGRGYEDGRPYEGKGNTQDQIGER